MSALRGLDPLRVVRLYVAVLGAGLLLDGALRLVLNVPDVPTNVLHGVSGIVLLGVAAMAGEGHELRAVWAAIVAGPFYVALGVLGLTLDQPFGLQLGPGENALHFAVGLVALVLGAWALRASSLTPAPSRSPARPAEFRNAPATHRRARRRRGKAHGQSRRR